MERKSRQEKISAALERHPDWKNYHIAKCIGVATAEVAAMRLGQSLPDQKPGSADPASTPGIISLEKVIQRYDIKSAILQELTRLKRGSFISENELCFRTAGHDKNRFRRTIENSEDEFRPLRVKLKIDDSKEGRWYWGHQEDIEEATRIRDL